MDPAAELNQAALAAPRPLRADARRNRARVLEAARAAFADQGRDAQMEDVARRADVGVGTVYRHFPTKEALIEALAAESFARVAEITRGALEIDDPWEAFATTLRQAAEVLASDRGFTEVMSEDVAQGPEVVAAREPLTESISELLRRAQEAGVVRADVCLDDIPMIMCGIGGATKKEHCVPDAWRRHLQIALDGLRAQAATAPLPRE